jgi:hypothetical protein
MVVGKQVSEAGHRLVQARLQTLGQLQSADRQPHRVGVEIHQSNLWQQ